MCDSLIAVSATVFECIKIFFPQIYTSLEKLIGIPINTYETTLLTTFRSASFTFTELKININVAV